MKEGIRGIKDKAIAITVFIIYTTGIVPLNIYGEERKSNGLRISNGKEIARKVIGKEGGELEGEGVRFIVPEGAVEEGVEIRISKLIRVEDGGEIKNVTEGEGGYRFEPSGIKFKKECIVELGYDERIEEEYAEEIRTYYYKEKRYYYHSDHLGSAQFVTDWRGKQYEHIEYTPYGELWVEETAPGIDKLPFRFTGKELDEETGLYYYGARYLDPKYSRWLSGDPALGEYIPQAPVNDEAKKHNENLPGMGGVFNVVNLHVYHYAGNNPVKYIDPDGRVSSKTEVILRIDGYLDKNNAFGMAKILYQYTKNPNEGAISSIVTAGVSFFGIAPAIVSSLASLVLALSNDEKNQINDFAFSIMTAVSEYGDFLDSGEYSIHVSGTMTTKNTIEFFRRKDEQFSNITTFSSDLNFTLVDKDGKEIKHLGKYTADPSAIKELLDKYSEKPIKVIEFYNGLPIKVESLE
ncbi:RHS repeat-associated protein [Treponema pedis]